jgi:hypothetical protein
MTNNEFLEAVQNYRTDDRMEALRDAMLYQNQGVNCVAVEVEESVYGLMLAKAADLAAAWDVKIISTRIASDG